MTIRRKVIPLERWIVDQNRIPSPVGKLFDADSRSPPWKAPFAILSNGHEHWFWNFERADQRDAYRIERLPSADDLERLKLKNMQPPRPLGSELVKPDYLRHLKHDLTLRRYQIAALDEVARLFDGKGLRKFLLEMATGTGKTL